MKILVTYNSKTGFTKQYAEWISEVLCCEVVSVKQMNNVENYDIVIHGGWIMGGMITGLEQVRKLNQKNLIVFGVGFTQEENYLETIKEINKLGDIPTFYFVGGTHPKKMNFFMRTMVKAATKKAVEEVDLTDKEFIQPLVKYVQEIKEKNCIGDGN